MNVARLNFSHGSLESHRKNILQIRSAARQLKRDIVILADLPGTKIRIGRLSHEPIFLKKGSDITLTPKNVLGTDSVLPVNYKRLSRTVSSGSTIYINDGFIQLRVKEVSSDEVKCHVVAGGPLLSYKGLNLPGAGIFKGALTQRDFDLIEFGLKEGLEVFGVSFVETASDITKAKEFAARKGKSIYVVAKIEREEAVRNIDEILKTADAIMIARGDLGVQMPIESVPGIQKELIHKANLSGCPVITATQMLESMTENIRPTRAEVTDVANAILDGTDAVMLSEETAIGKYPVEAAEMAVKIAATIERQRAEEGSLPDLQKQIRNLAGRKKVMVEDVISLNVIEAAKALNVRFVLTPTKTWSTPRRISRFKPGCWILSFSREKKACKILAFSYGVFPFLMQNEGGEESSYHAIVKFIQGLGLIRKGDKLIITEGTTPGHEGDGTNLLRVISL